MADVREFIYNGKRVRISVNQSGAEYVGVIDIEGMALANNKVGAQYSSADAAYESAKRKAEELIDSGVPRSLS